MNSAAGLQPAKTPTTEIISPPITELVTPMTESTDSAIYLLRTTQQHHVQLSSMADHKASMLMGAAFVILTLLVGQITRGGFSLPILTLGIFASIATVFAVLAVIPRVGKKDVDGPPNLLFFGSFLDLSSEEYIEKMETALRSDETVYRMLLLDIYQQGKILGEKKFKYLSYSYRLFLFGTVAAFVVAVVSYAMRRP